MLHLGNGRMVLKAHITFILDYEECVRNKSSAACIETLSTHAECVHISKTDIKSLIYTQHDNQDTLYYSPISTGTLLKRAHDKFADLEFFENTSV